MEFLNHCPKCNGEVDMVKLNKKDKRGNSLYRLTCKRCRLTVAQGRGFPDELEQKAEERVQQYESYLKEYAYGNAKRKDNMESSNEKDEQPSGCGSSNGKSNGGELLEPLEYDWE